MTANVNKLFGHDTNAFGYIPSHQSMSGAGNVYNPSVPRLIVFFCLSEIPNTVILIRGFGTHPKDSLSHADFKNHPVGYFINAT